MSHFCESTSIINEHFPFARSSAVVYRNQPPPPEDEVCGRELLTQNGGASFDVKTGRPFWSKINSASFSQQTPQQSFLWQHPSYKRRTPINKARHQKRFFHKRRSKSEEYFSNLRSLSARYHKKNNDSEFSSIGPVSADKRRISLELQSRKWNNSNIPSRSQSICVPNVFQPYEQIEKETPFDCQNFFAIENSQPVTTSQILCNSKNIIPSVTIDHQELRYTTPNTQTVNQQNFKPLHHGNMQFLRYSSQENQNINLYSVNSQPSSYQTFIISPNSQSQYSKHLQTKDENLFPSVDEVFRKSDMSNSFSCSTPPSTFINKISASDWCTSKASLKSRWLSFTNKSSALSPSTVVEVKNNDGKYIFQDSCSDKLNHHSCCINYNSSFSKQPKTCFAEGHNLSKSQHFIQNYCKSNSVYHNNERFGTHENRLIGLLEPIAQSTPKKISPLVKRQLILKDKSTQVHFPCGLKRCREE